MKNNKNTGPIMRKPKKKESPTEAGLTGRRDGQEVWEGTAVPRAKLQSTYDWLSAKFWHIDKALTRKPELQADLDGIVDGLAETLDLLFNHNKKVFEETVQVMQEQCAAAICPLCHDATPRKEHNGREVHTVKEGTTVRCAANSIWSMGARLRGLRPTPYGLFVNKMMELPKVKLPESGQT